MPVKKIITAAAFAARQAKKKKFKWIDSKISPTAKQKAETAKRQAAYRKANPLSKKSKAQIKKNKAKEALDKKKWNTYQKSIASKTDMSGRPIKPKVKPKVKRTRKKVDPARKAYLDAGLEPNYIGQGYHKNSPFRKQYGGAVHNKRGMKVPGMRYGN